MCGIFSILNLKNDVTHLRNQTLKLAKRLRHRGPDWSGMYTHPHALLAHERLAIVDVIHGAQPLYDEAKTLALAVNGEIYNHQELRSSLKGTHSFQTLSDCEVILYLYKEMGVDFLPLLNGIFAFVLYNETNNSFLVARDSIGVIPLYMGQDKEGNLYFASEMKALIDSCPHIEEFPPGHYFVGTPQSTDFQLADFQGKINSKGSSEEATFPSTAYYQPSWFNTSHLPTKNIDLTELRESLEKAVKRQLMCDVPYGVLLSGGLDSSLIAAIVNKFKEKRVENKDQSQAWWPRLHTFSVGLKGSPDLKAAQKVASFLNTIHHEFHFTIQEGLDALNDVVYHLETYDVTTIRAATPMYLMSRKIKAMGIKMVLSGEGSDEIFGGYLYFHKAPNPEEFFQETVRKIRALHLYDCLRANKATSAFGIEARVPFLDTEFLDMAMGIDPQDKMIRPPRKMEKQILREAFQGYLPDEILWRQKEQFSDGVGYSWIDSLKAEAEQEISDQVMEKAKFRFPHNTPQTKEAYWYRTLFESHFPGSSAEQCIPGGPSVACSSPVAIKWDKAFETMIDPSGRAVRDVHGQGKEN